MVKIAINIYLYQSVVPVSLSIASARQLHGKELSYNNIRDADAALRIASEFTEPTVVAVKHMNPCGIGTGKTILAAYRQAFEADPVSIFWWHCCFESSSGPSDCG